MLKQIIDKLEIIIDETLSCWRNLRLSTKIVKIYGIEDFFIELNQKYNGIECFNEDFIEQDHQFRMLDVEWIADIKDRVKASINYSKIEIIVLNGEI